MTNEKDLTPWFAGNVKPVRIGLYRTRDANRHQWFNWFDGERWHWGGWKEDIDLEGPATSDPMDVFHQSRHVKAWRGLAHPPKGA
jgi:hypothetical protein